MAFEKLLIYAVTYFGLFTAVFFLLTFIENRRQLKKPRSNYFPKVSVGVPMYDVADHLRLTVDSLINLDYPKNKLEIIIVDDGSTDNSYKIAKEYLSKGNVKLLQQKNSGKCAAINLALKNATGDFFGVLDVDAFVTSSSLKKMMTYFKNPLVMAVTPSLKVYSPKSLLQRIQMIEFLLGVYLRKVFAFLGSIHVTPGCFTIYRKSFFDETGPYQDNNLTEDIEIAYRIQTYNYYIENSIDANVYTLGVKKFKALLNQRLRWYKGFLDNTIAYRRIFSFKFGNLGLFILPSAFLSILVAGIMSVYSLTKFFQQMVSNVLLFINTNFDISQYFQWTFDPFFINLNAVFFLAAISMVVSIVGIYIAKKCSDEKESVVLSFVLFAFTYLFLFSFWWVGAAYCKLTKRKIRWGNLYL